MDGIVVSQGDKFILSDAAKLYKRMVNRKGDTLYRNIKLMWGITYGKGSFNNN